MVRLCLICAGRMSQLCINVTIVSCTNNRSILLFSMPFLRLQVYCFISWFFNLHMSVRSWTFTKILRLLTGSFLCKVAFETTLLKMDFRSRQTIKYSSVLHSHKVRTKLWQLNSVLYHYNYILKSSKTIFNGLVLKYF